MKPLELALNVRGDDLHSLHLLALLLSAQKHYQHALDTLKLALNQHPDNFKYVYICLFSTLKGYSSPKNENSAVINPHSKPV